MGKLFVLSLDALIREDVAYLLTKPNFFKIMEKRAELCDIAPTLARVLGQTLPGAEGRVLTELLR